MLTIENKIKIGVLVEEKGKLLLIRELNNKDDKYYWNLIKGTFEHQKDENLFAAVKRECKEEAGILVKINYLQSIMYLHRKNVMQFNFGATIQKGKPKIPSPSHQKEEGENIIELRFFNKEEIRKIKEKEFMNKRAFMAVKNWLKRITNNLGVLHFE
jgi:NADH pyrophosphatase NudC (nudix superfamily)